MENFHQFPWLPDQQPCLVLVLWPNLFTRTLCMLSLVKIAIYLLKCNCAIAVVVFHSVCILIHDSDVNTFVLCGNLRLYLTFLYLTVWRFSVVLCFVSALPLFYSTLCFHAYLTFCNCFSPFPIRFLVQIGRNPSEFRLQPGRLIASIVQCSCSSSSDHLASQRISLSGIRTDRIKKTIELQT